MAAAIPLVMLAATGVSGALANRKKTTASTTMPTVDPAFSGVQGLVLKNVTDRLSAPSALPAGYESNAIADTNRTFDLTSQRSANDLTARGLGTSPVAGVVEGNNQNARASSISQLINSLPFLNRQLQTEDLGLAGNLLNLGRGSTTTGTTPGNMVGGAFSSMASMMAYLYGKGAFGGGGSTGGLNFTPAMPGTY